MKMMKIFSILQNYQTIVVLNQNKITYQKMVKKGLNYLQQMKNKTTKKIKNKIILLKC